MILLKIIYMHMQNFGEIRGGECNRCYISNFTQNSSPCNYQLFYIYLILYSRNYSFNFNFLYLRFHVFIVTFVFSGWCIVNIVSGFFKCCFPVPAALPQLAVVMGISDHFTDSDLKDHKCYSMFDLNSRPD